ncbi:hypothetical protein EV421DRAFT_2023606 [Armillaria borealis]|uniref:Uncharacterized protein n=1 Tax=Armillaria borealis TaxID=47425 RepID=A0AA39J0K5_9AGAR|nr:hypothetical protein EV421DRAFT_2023606 [Armillaria borealis]
MRELLDFEGPRHKIYSGLMSRRGRCNSEHDSRRRHLGMGFIIWRCWTIWGRSWRVVLVHILCTAMATGMCVYHRVVEVLVESASLHSAIIVVLLVFEVRNEGAGAYIEEFAIAMGGIVPTILVGRIAAGHARPDDSWDESTTSTSLRFRGHSSSQNDSQSWALKRAWKAVHKINTGGIMIGRRWDELRHDKAIGDIHDIDGQPLSHGTDPTQLPSATITTQYKLRNMFLIQLSSGAAFLVDVYSVNTASSQVSTARLWALIQPKANSARLPTDEKDITSAPI